MTSALFRHSQAGNSSELPACFFFTCHMKPLFLLGTFLLIALLTPGDLARAQPGPALDALVKDALKEWHVPGCAVAIVHDDRVIYLKGFGHRELGKNDPVTPDTVFPIASCSKSFTALLLGMLADEGKLNWDDPVSKHLPYFRLTDPLADANVTLRDLLTHRTGIGSHDLMWYKSPWALEERIRRTCRLNPRYSFRSTFEYQTVLFGAAGEAAAKAAGKDWRDLVQQRLFDPLGMTSSHPVQPGKQEKVEWAEPHRRHPKGSVERIPRYPLNDPDPAGSIHATARDMARYLRFQLGDGTWQGQRLISQANLAEPHTPQIVLRLEGSARRLHPETFQMSYGLGWIALDYRGHGAVLHGGVIDGFRAQLTLVPKARLGIAVLSNLDHTFMNFALTNALLDTVLRLPYKDWNTIVHEALIKGEEEKLTELKELMASRKPGTKASIPLEAFAGRYKDAAYGPCRIKLEKGGLVWEWGRFRCPLEHFHFDVFIGREEVLLADTLFTFQVKNGIAHACQVMGQTFRRVKDAP